MLYATPVHAVRDVHHVSDYHTIAEESVRFDPIGRLPSYHVARLTTKRILQQSSRVTPLTQALCVCVTHCVWSAVCVFAHPCLSAHYKIQV